MPVTAKLSRKFYETFGDEIANELVEWFNQVDATYRADLMRLNELNFGRFDAKVDQRITQLDAKWSRIWQELDAKLEKRFAQLDARLEKRFAQSEVKFEQLDSRWERRWNELDSKLEQQITELRAEFKQEITGLRAELHTGLATSETKLIRWMFLFWAGTLVPLAALILTMMLGR